MHPFNLNQIINKVIKVFGVVDVEVDGALKNAVVTVEVDGAHVHILVVRNHLGDFAHDANLVDPRKGNEGQKGKNFMAFPVGGDDAVALTRHEANGNGALAAVQNELVVVVHIADHIVAGNGVAAVGNHVVLIHIVAHHHFGGLLAFGCAPGTNAPCPVGTLFTEGQAPVAHPLVGRFVAQNLVQIVEPNHILANFKIRSEEHTSELQSRPQLVCRLLLEKKK